MMPASASREMTASMHTYLVRARRTGSIAGRLSQKGPPGVENSMVEALSLPLVDPIADGSLWPAIVLFAASMNYQKVFKGEPCGDR